MPTEEPSATVMTVELSLSVRVRSEPSVAAPSECGDGGDLSFCERGVGEL